MKLMLEHNLDDGLQMIDGVVHFFFLVLFSVSDPGFRYLGVLYR